MNRSPWGARMVGFTSAIAVSAAACSLAFGWQVLETADRVAAAAGSPPGSAAPPISPTPRSPASSPTSPVDPPSALSTDEYSAAGIEDLLAQVRVVAARPHVAGDDRDCGPGDGCVFGTEWSDDTNAPDSHNGCDTRNDVLHEQLLDVTFKAGSNDCDVVAGHFTDPYTGAEMDYATEGSEIHVDHLFALAAAWDFGAAGWTPAQRSRFANDTALELLAVSGSANMSKGDSTPASWLPTVKPYRCEYVTRYLRVAVAYQLAITDADRTVIRFVERRSCPA